MKGLILEAVVWSVLTASVLVSLLTEDFLIFFQEAFLSFHGFIYLRLDGSTRVEQRQLLMERFNNNVKYFAFILSTRSGGVGINLTGADTVIFYDSDWNPTMDAQAQDRSVLTTKSNPNVGKRVED